MARKWIDMLARGEQKSWYSYTLKYRYHYDYTQVENHHWHRKYFGYRIVERLSMQTFRQESNLVNSIAIEL